MPRGVRYDSVTVVLVNAVKEQQAQIEAQQKQIKEQQKLIEGLRRLVCRDKPADGVCANQ